MANYQAYLTQGSTDFSPLVAYDGVDQSWTQRCAASVVTLDGTMRKTWIKKRVLTVKLQDMYDDDLRLLFSGISDLAVWDYLDTDTGERSASFYLSGPTVRQTLAREGKTLCTGISFTLEER